MVVIEQSSLANPPIDMHRDASTDPLPIQTRFRSRLLAYFLFNMRKISQIQIQTKMKTS